MSLNILNSDWLSQNANRNYPLDDAATCVSVDEALVLPPGFLLDLVWPVHVSLGQDPQRFYLRSLVSTGDAIIGSLAYILDDDVTPAVVGSFTVPVAGHASGGLYTIAGAGEFSDSAGRVVVGSLEGVLAQGGVYQFDLPATRLSPAVIRPNLRGVSSIRVASATGLSEPLTGDIVLREGTNIRFTAEAGNVIRIDAVNIPSECDCGTQRAIQTINSIAPDANGNFELAGDECFDIAPMTSGLKFTDLCSKSCCGCDELTAMTRDLDTNTRALRQMEALLSKLEGKMDNATANILASIVNDPTCGG